MIFSDLQDGDDFLLDGIKYRKTRPWSPRQFNASLMEDMPHKPTFIKVKGDTPVERYFRYYPS
jgi:hypothetical protein